MQSNNSNVTRKTKKVKKEPEQKIEKFVELYDGSFGKITQEYKNGMYVADIFNNHSKHPIGTLYFPESYIKSIEEVIVSPVKGSYSN